MSYEVFISYAKQNKDIADSICSTLESKGIYCWIAPRNISSGVIFPEAIIKGIVESKILLLVLSSHSDNSNHVKNEVSIALDNKLTILPFCVENFSLSNEMNYFIRRYQLFEAYTPSIEESIQRLPNVVMDIIDHPSTDETVGSPTKVRLFKKTIKEIHYFPDEPPELEEFVDRVDYLDNLNNSLDRSMIIIQGLAGIGKTLLAAKFKRFIEDDYITSWKELHNFDTFDTLAQFFAGFLRENDDTKLVEYLESGQQDRESITSILLQSIENKQYIFFFDNYHEVKDDEIHDLFKRLKDGMKRSTIILTTRTEPPLISQADKVKNRISEETVEGFNITATKEYLESIRVYLTDEQLSKLDQCIKGHPLFMLMIAQMINENDLDEILENIPETSIDKYLYDEVYSRLNEDEQKLFEVMSIFRIPFTPDACVHVSRNKNIKKTLRVLEEKLLVKKKKAGLYYLHDILRDFSYNLIDDSTEYHQRAGEYYSKLEKTLPNILETIYHTTKSSVIIDDNLIKYFVDTPTDFYIDMIIADFIQSKRTESPFIFELIRKILCNDNIRVRWLAVVAISEHMHTDFDKSLEFIKQIITDESETNHVRGSGIGVLDKFMKYDFDKCMGVIDLIISDAQSDHIELL